MRASVKRTINAPKTAGRKLSKRSISQSEDPLENGLDESTIDVSSNSTSTREKSKANRQIDIDEQTGKRSFRDESGRRRYLCSDPSCTNMLKRQTDSFCQKHTPKTDEENLSNNDEFRSPCSTPTKISKVDNEIQLDEHEIPTKSSVSVDSIRSFRDASGKIRFLCSIPTCTSRLVRRSDIFCKRHQLMPINETHVEQMDVNHNNNNNNNEVFTNQLNSSKKSESILKSNLSFLRENQIVLASTTLLDDQWNDVIRFIRQYSQVKLSPNFNVNHLTTHLLVNDHDDPLRCIITKKVVQAAVRRNVFIISSRWITDSLKSNKFLSEYPYEIESDSHTNLRPSKPICFLNDNQQYLFSNSYAFAIECRQCQGSINRNELIELIQLSGARYFDKSIDEKIEILVVLCDTNEGNIDEIKQKYSMNSIRIIKYVTSDYFLKSIIKFEIQDIDKYTL